MAPVHGGYSERENTCCKYVTKLETKREHRVELLGMG